jgi:hypothetical protein
MACAYIIIVHAIWHHDRLYLCGRSSNDVSASMAQRPNSPATHTNQYKHDDSTGNVNLPRSPRGHPPLQAAQCSELLGGTLLFTHGLPLGTEDAHIDEVNILPVAPYMRAGAPLRQTHTPGMRGSPPRVCIHGGPTAELSGAAASSDNMALTTQP